MSCLTQIVFLKKYFFFYIDKPNLSAVLCMTTYFFIKLKTLYENNMCSLQKNVNTGSYKEENFP